MKKIRLLTVCLALALTLCALPAFAVTAQRAVISQRSAVIDLAQGDTLDLDAYVLPDAASQSVVWLSKNTAIASVDQNGVVTAKKTGKALIGVRPAGVKTWSVCRVTVKDSVMPKSMLLSAVKLNMAVGDTQSVTATLRPAASDQGVKWTSARPAIASVDAMGVITAKKNGTTVIRARSTRNKALTKKITVKVAQAIAPTRIVLTPEDKTMEVGEKLTLTATPQPESASSLVKWYTSNAAIATVNGGVVTALSEGTVKITVRSMADTTVYTVRTLKITDSAKPTSVSIEPDDDVYLAEGDALELTATVLPASAAQAVTWTSDKPTVASVSGNGVITARGAGKALITVKTAVGGLTDEIQVTVIEAGRSSTVPDINTSVSGIAANLAKIDAIRLSANSELESLVAKGKITSSEKAKRKNVIIEAFANYRFPWVTTKKVLYWNGNSAKYYAPGKVYYGAPYTQYQRTYNVAKLLNQGYYNKSGTYYTTSSLININYPGNDCSSFVSMCHFGNNSGNSFLNSRDIYKSTLYKTLSGGWDDLRPGDIFVKNGHVVLFLYYLNSGRSVMVIEQGGGAEPNTVACRIRALSYYENSGTYIARRRSGFAG